MTEQKNYSAAHQIQNTNEWMMAGVVIASPSSGKIKAFMPIFNSYSDIRIEQIFPIDEDSLVSEPTEIRGDFKEAETPLKILSEDPLPEHNLSATLHLQERTPAKKLSIGRSIMKHATSIDMRDLSIMVGLASLLGAMTNMIYSLATGSTAPQLAVIMVTALGFVSGRFLSHVLRTEHHE